MNLKKLSDEKVTKAYVEEGRVYWDYLTTWFDCRGSNLGLMNILINILSKGEILEKEYARRGYKPLEIDDFELALFGEDMSEKLYQKIPAGETTNFPCSERKKELEKSVKEVKTQIYREKGLDITKKEFRY